MIFSRDVGLGHGVLLHLLRDNILQRVKFRGATPTSPSDRIARDVPEQQFADPIGRLIGGEMADPG